jgi:hypothetical protein
MLSYISALFPKINIMTSLRRVRIGLAPSLAAVSAALMLLLTFVTLQLVGQTVTKQVETDIGRNLAELAFQTTDKLDRGMYERYREVKLMAERHEITDPKVPVATKRALLEGMQNTHPYYAWIGLTDNRGTVKIASKGLLEEKNVSARPWFAGAYEGVHFMMCTKRSCSPNCCRTLVASRSAFSISLFHTAVLMGTFSAFSAPTLAGSGLPTLSVRYFAHWPNVRLSIHLF